MSERIWDIASLVLFLVSLGSTLPLLIRHPRQFRPLGSYVLLVQLVVGWAAWDGLGRTQTLHQHIRTATLTGGAVVAILWVLWCSRSNRG